jgi:hypothetical protein
VDAEIISINAERMKRRKHPGGFCADCVAELRALAKGVTLEPDDYPRLLDLFCSERFTCSAKRR